MAKKTDNKKYILMFWGVVLAGILFSVLLFQSISWGAFGKLPSFDDLENPKSNLASEVYSSDKKLLGTYYVENRTNAEHSELSQYLVDALTATEDARFEEHSGIDFRGLARAIFFLGSRGGASTISQQLAKNLFETKGNIRGGRVIQKLGEWIIAVRLERQYTKEEIMTMYLNTFDFINGAVGVKTASAVYFNTTTDSLQLEEAATLVGMVKNPSLFNPRRYPDTTQHRRNVVMKQMVKYGYLEQAKYDSLKQLPLALEYRSVDHKEGIGSYFRETLRLKLHELFNQKDTIKGEVYYHYRKPDGEPYDIYRDGLKVYTTINSRMQEYAEWAVQEHLSKDLQPNFWKDLKGKKNAPFDSKVSQKDIDNILDIAMRRSQRYRILTGKECANCGRRGEKNVTTEKKDGKFFYICQAADCEHERPATPKDSVDIIFNTPVKMEVYTWQGERDTVMSPMDSIRYYKSFLQAGFMAMDPHTGYIKAWVGGINYKHFAYDHVMQAKRQVGSTFKPFVYALAIQEGYSPCYEVPNIRYCFTLPDGKEWCPKNSEDDYGYNVTLKYGLANSQNTVTAWTMKQFSPEAVVNFARKVGIKSPMDPVPALCLGVADLSVYEMVGANSTFANKGVWTEPIFITRIEDKNGTVIAEFLPETKEVMGEDKAYVMLNLMQGVVDGVYNNFKKKRTGTGVRLRFKYGFKNEIAGKTGTTQNNSDGWFMGITPDLVSGCWVGGEDRSVRFTRTYYGQGANSALPIWALFMQKVYEDKKLGYEKRPFDRPDNISVELDCEKYNKDKKPDRYKYN